MSSVRRSERLRSVHPKGFSLDASHHPRISMFSVSYVGSSQGIFAVADKVLASGNVTNFELTAFEYYYFPDKDLGLSGIVIKPTAATAGSRPNLHRYRRHV